MTCREAIERVMEYLSDELPADQRRMVKAHLATCPPCTAYAKSYDEVVKLGKAVLSHPDERAVPDMPEELVQAILAAASRKPT